jgi:uncharacterized repeat protein (TIGR03847 family)
MAVTYEYHDPDRFVAGTVGLPGQRTFYLQVRGGARTTSVALEKLQVSLLAERLDALLDAVLRRSAGTANIPAVSVGVDDLDPLELPLDEQFRVGTIGLGWDGDNGRVVIEAYADSPSDLEISPTADELRGSFDAAVAPDEPSVVPGDRPGVDPDGDEGDQADEHDDDEDDDDPDLSGHDVVRVHLTGQAARAFAARAASVVAAGRPACPLCTLPLDPDGHICPRQNGYRRTP